MSEPNEELLLVKQYIAREHLALFYDIAPLYGSEPNLHSPWKTQVIYPTQKRYEVPEDILNIADVKEEDRKPIPHIPIIEIMGLPDSGKSTLCKDLKGKYPKAVIKDESIKSYYPLTQNLDSTNLLVGLDKLTNVFPAFQESLMTKIGQLHGDVPIKSPAVLSRGANDILSFTLPLYLSLYVSHGDVDTDIFELVSSHFLKLLISQLSFIDAVVLFDNDLETASKRRIKNGSTKYGKVVNPEIWPVIEKGYSWWLQYVFPILRERYGTGLLIVNGRNHYKQNNGIVNKYIGKILKDLPTV